MGRFFQSPNIEVASQLMSAVYDQRRMPLFLENVAPDAEVHSGFLDILDSFQRREDGSEVLAETVKEISGVLPKSSMSRVVFSALHAAPSSL